MKLPAQQCVECGERYFSDEAVSSFDLLVASKLARAGIASPEAIKFIRKATGLQGKELAALLHVRAETVSRWERAKRSIDLATFAIFSRLVEDRLNQRTDTVDLLRAMGTGRLPKIVELYDQRKRRAS
jgi:DNA-binding transcriptional regulator YiaG